MRHTLKKVKRNIFFIKKIVIYLFILERERERTGRGAKGEGERESQADSAPSKELNLGLDPVILRSQPQVKERVGYLTN